MFKKVCVIGAGPSGITAAKNLLDEGHEVVVYDQGREVGGNWVFDEATGHSSVFETTHIISSKQFSQYDDYPMPDSYPDYPSHLQLAEYFQAYARTFNLYPVPEGVPVGITPTIIGVKKSVRDPIRVGFTKLPLASDKRSWNILFNGNAPSVKT
mgnify:CR=1 FL=1